MPNYTTNILKIYVPEVLDPLVDGVVAALAAKNVEGPAPRDPEARYENVARWIDFERISPIHPVFDEADEDSADFRAALHLNDGIWPPSIPRPEPLPATPEARTTLALQLRPGLAGAVAAVKRRIELAGTPHRIEWQQARWGVKWTPPEIASPEFFRTDEYDAFQDYSGCTAISYEFITPWGMPEVYASALGEWCQRLGLGMQWWYSHEDGGSVLNPRTNEIETAWTESEEHRIHLEDLPHIEIAALLASGIPDDVAEDQYRPVTQEELPWKEIINSMFPRVDAPA